MIVSSSIKRILVINLAYIGDVVLSSPVIRALKSNYPEAEIDMLVMPFTKLIAERIPYVREAIVYDKRGRHKNIKEFVSLAKYLRSIRYDIAVSTNFSLRSSAMTWVCGARIRAGYDAQHGKIFLTHVRSSLRPEIRHETKNNLEVLQSLGIETCDNRMELILKQEDREGLIKKVKLSGERPVIVIAPVGSHPVRTWTTAGYAAVIKEVAAISDCFLTGAAKDKPFLDELNNMAGGVAKVLAGTLNLAELAVLIQRAEFIISVDTGTLHIAGAVGTPVISLFGPSDPRVWGPQGSQDVVLKADVACMPCWGKSPCTHRTCMKSLRTEDVLSVIREFLRNISINDK